MGKQYAKGRTYEHRFCKILENHGFFVVRIPASGRRQRGLTLPDVIAIRLPLVLFFDVKYRRASNVVYLENRTYHSYKALENMTKAKVYLAIYYSHKGQWYVVHIDCFSEKDDRKVTYREKDVLEKGMEVNEFLRMVVHAKLV